MANPNDDLTTQWRELGEKIEKLKAEIDEMRRERRTAVITLIERKKKALIKEKTVNEERPGSPRAIEVFKLPDPWDNYYYMEGIFYTRALVGNFGSGDQKLLRQIGEGETDVLIGGSNLVETLVALPDIT